MIKKDFYVAILIVLIILEMGSLYISIDSANNSDTFTYYTTGKEMNGYFTGLTLKIRAVVFPVRSDIIVKVNPTVQYLNNSLYYPQYLKQISILQSLNKKVKQDFSNCVSNYCEIQNNLNPGSLFLFISFNNLTGIINENSVVGIEISYIEMPYFGFQNTAIILLLIELAFIKLIFDNFSKNFLLPDKFTKLIILYTVFIIGDYWYLFKITNVSFISFLLFKMLNLMVIMLILILSVFNWNNDLELNMPKFGKEVYLINFLKTQIYRKPYNRKIFTLQELVDILPASFEDLKIDLVVIKGNETKRKYLNRFGDYYDDICEFHIKQKTRLEEYKESLIIVLFITLTSFIGNQLMLKFL